MDIWDERHDDTDAGHVYGDEDGLGAVRGTVIAAVVMIILGIMAVIVTIGAK